MTQAIRLLLLFEAATFIIAALIHRGYFVAGYAHARAHVAESIIAAVLLGGFLLTLFLGSWTRTVGLVAQGFALLGTLVGIFTIIIGVGPRTVPDIIYHIAIVAVLTVGLLVARQATA